MTPATIAPAAAIARMMRRSTRAFLGAARRECRKSTVIGLVESPATASATADAHPRNPAGGSPAPSALKSPCRAPSPSASARPAVTEAPGLGARQGDLSALGAGDPPAGLRGCASAVALAVAGLSTSPMTVDFLHSRLAAPKKARVERRIILAIAAAGAIVAGVIAAYVDQNKMETTLANKQAQLEERKKPDKAAVENVKMIEFAEQWHAGTPRYLDCLRDLLKAVPQDAQLYLTSFDLRDNMQGKLNGKTTSDKNVQSLVDRLRATHRFSDLKPGYSQGTNRADREVSFSLDFNYLAAGAH